MITALKRGSKKAFVTYVALIKVIIPVYILVTFLRHTGIIQGLAEFTAPVMAIFGLPGEAMLALLTGYLLNLYGAIGVMVGLDLGVREVTILGTMLALAHSLIIEAAVIKKVSGKIFSFVALRVGLSIFAGVLLNFLL